MKSRDISLLEKIYLKPGELVVTEEPVVITTVLGSCVAVTMFHKPTGAAAVCHAMQPNGHGSKNFRYVDAAVYYMVKFFHKQKISRKEIEVKLFGGSDMFKSVQPEMRNLTVGSQNVSAAYEYMQLYDLTAKMSDTGGRRGRKLVFTTDTGVVYIKKLHHQEAIL